MIGRFLIVSLALVGASAAGVGTNSALRPGPPPTGLLVALGFS